MSPKFPHSEAFLLSTLRVDLVIKNLINKDKELGCPLIDGEQLLRL